MNCRQAKLEIALCVGEDLTDADRREKLRHHLTGCPDCRAHMKRLKGMFRVLEHAEGQQTYDSVESLWPGLSSRLGQPRPRLNGPRFNGWVPFSVMAAACVLLMIVMEMQPDSSGTIPGSVFPRGVWGAGIGVRTDANHEPTAITDEDVTPDAPERAGSQPAHDLLIGPATDDGPTASNPSF